MVRGDVGVARLVQAKTQNIIAVILRVCSLKKEESYGSKKSPPIKAPPPFPSCALTDQWLAPLSVSSSGTLALTQYVIKEWLFLRQQ